MAECAEWVEAFEAPDRSDDPDRSDRREAESGRPMGEGSGPAARDACAIEGGKLRCEC